MTESNPTIRGFFSYSRQNDLHDRGNLSRLRKSLEMEVWNQSGEKTEIFQDQDDIYWGQEWRDKITKALRTSDFLIAIITPSYLKSESCRFEFEYFLERETRLGGERILPLLYIATPELKNKSDSIAIEINKRQWFDWTSLRFSYLTSAKIRKQLSTFAKQIADLTKKEIVFDVHRQIISIPNSVVINTQVVENWPAGWTDEWQPSFNVDAIVSPPESKKSNLEASSMPVVPSVYISFEETLQHKRQQQITINIQSQKNPEAARKLIKTVYGTFISFHGRDLFSFRIFEQNRIYLIDFPNDTTRICIELLARLKKVLGYENWTIEPVLLK
jgi:hypothetical protein